MRKVIALVSSLLLVATLATPAQSAEADYSVDQKTLATFSSSATTLTTQQKAQVKAAVDANPTAEKFICTGIRYHSQPMSINIMVRKRAKAACEYAKQLNPELSTWFQNKPTQAKSYAGKVLLTVKTLEAPSIEPPEKLPPERREALPALDSAAQGPISDAQRASWNYKIRVYGTRISEFQREINQLAATKDIEKQKLDTAIQYGDNLRESIQRDAITEIDRRIASLRSTIEFYTSLINTYQSRIDQTYPGTQESPTPDAGPSQRQIDSWTRLISLNESRIASDESRMARVSADLRKFTYWRSIAEKYGDTGRVRELDIDIEDANLTIDGYRASIDELQAEIDILREKIAG